jgi:hypothetical protein
VAETSAYTRAVRALREGAGDEPRLARSAERLDRVAQALALRQSGMSRAQIATELGVAVSTVASYLTDPDGADERRRKARGRGRCVVCGAPAKGRRTIAGAPDRCLQCTAAGRRIWTRESVLEALSQWAEQTGKWPTSYDLDRSALPSRLKSTRPKTLERAKTAAQLHATGNYPDAKTVASLFGSVAGAEHALPKSRAAS